MGLKYKSPTQFERRWYLDHLKKRKYEVSRAILRHLNMLTNLGLRSSVGFAIQILELEFRNSFRENG